MALPPVTETIRSVARRGRPFRHLPRCQPCTSRRSRPMNRRNAADAPRFGADTVTRDRSRRWIARITPEQSGRSCEPGENEENGSDASRLDGHEDKAPGSTRRTRDLHCDLHLRCARAAAERLVSPGERRIRRCELATYQHELWAQDIVDLANRSDGARRTTVRLALAPKPWSVLRRLV